MLVAGSDFSSVATGKAGVQLQTVEAPLETKPKQSQYFSGSSFVVNKCSRLQGQRSAQQLGQCLFGLPAKEAVTNPKVFLITCECF